MPKTDALYNDLAAPYIGHPPYHVTPKPQKSNEVPQSTWARLKQENEERKLDRKCVTVEQAGRMNREHGVVREVRKKETEDGNGKGKDDRKGKECTIM